MTEHIGIIGLGAYVPERVMTNDDWSAYLDTSDEWITERTGIKERRFVAEGESTADLATAAAREALTDAGLGAADVDEIIVATDTPEVYTPDTAAFVQVRLGAGNVPAFDLGGSGCAGWVLGLDIARSRAVGGRTILVIGVEVLSRLMDWTDRSTAVLFGDGAGAVVIGSAPGAAEILAVVAGTDGSKAEILGLMTGGTREPFGPDAVATGAYRHVTMDGREVFRQAVTRMTEASREVLAAAGASLSDVALVVPHQANIRIIDAVRRALDLDDGKVFTNLQSYGNTGSASIPLALTEARAAGRFGRGDLVLLTAFGAGFHWAAALVRF
jgi:3-oxoacyl-[acyl-carrier-protein] synthase-3